MSRYDGPSFFRHDHRSGVEGSHPVTNKFDFPNYLKKEDEEHGIMEVKGDSAQPSSYISQDLLHPMDTVPYIRHNKEAFVSFRDQAVKPAEDIFAVEKKRLKDEKQKERRTELGMHPFASYKSRRPFQLTEVPEPLKGWENLKEKKIDYRAIAAVLKKNSSDLLIFELASPVEDDVALEEDSVETSDLQPLEGKSKRAMNRSLLGIMEQERAYDVAGKFVHEPADSVSHSYF
ncbi:hypothetical protein C8U37_10148 [Trichococcus patagoniensis]|uniref:Uncharacterized protein n=1 Tax=Trichococcus patagoniensis TaxID=382641 RepID=A0A2T5IQX6_9LACT|nr:hypothetical protein C8U37_10148 [Trichococcus patagoniensis]